MQPISILACGGQLPLEVAEILRRQGREPNIVTIEGVADADYSGYRQHVVGIGQFGRLLAALRVDGTREMLIAGHARRPDIRSIKFDLGVLIHAFTIFKFMRGGDDHVLRQVVRFFERNGLEVKGIIDVAPTLLTPEGMLAGSTTPQMVEQVHVGLELIQQLGPFDVGQAVVMQGKQVVAVEGAEGTNGLLDRLPKVTSGASANRLLVKAAKPSQDLRVDLPTVGSETVDRCKGSGIDVIALEAERSLIVDRCETIKRASQCEMTMIGLATLPTLERAQYSPQRLKSHSRRQPRKRDIRNATKGLAVLAALSATSASGVIVAREAVLAINLCEPFDVYLSRSSELGHWGDQRDKHKRNRVLAISSANAMPLGMIGVAAQSKVLGIAVLDVAMAPKEFDDLVDAANALDLFVVSPS